MSERLAWLFIGAVSGFDVAFAMVHRETILLWEANPLARWVIMHWGFAVAVAFRLASVFFAAGVVPLAPTTSRLAYLLFLLALHLYLALIYLRILIC